MNDRSTGVVVTRTAIDGASICFPCAISLALFLKHQKLSIEAELQLHQEKTYNVMVMVMKIIEVLQILPLIIFYKDQLTSFSDHNFTEVATSMYSSNTFDV